MTTSLTAEIALAYVRQLSADFRAGVVLNGALEPVAGDEGLAGAARALWRAHPGARELHADQVFAARTSGHAIVVVTGPHALSRVVRRDIRTALSGVGAESAQETPSERPSGVLVEALLTAAADAFRRHSAV
jgi:hypothetical protein